MRSLLAALAACALAVAATGCGSACQDLGDRLCRCAAGVSRDSCEQQVKNDLSDRSPGTSFCERTLDTCNAPSGADFCEWLQTPCGKASCGLSSAPISGEASVCR